MDSVFIISDRVKKPFMVVISRTKGTEFKPLTSDAKNLSRYLIDEYKKQPITKGELSQVIDANMDIQGPSPLNSATKKKIERLISESELPAYPKGTSPPKNETLLKAKSAHVVRHLPVLSISEVAISEFSTMEHRNVIQYKAASFVSDQTKTTFNYEVKRVRAMWDPSLSIPGTDRRGGWRCPVGTRYGGQITDRFGRNCGWGVARRIANAITNIGDRLENIDDRRRGRRVERRNNRMIERLRRDERGGRLERGLGAVADVLDGGETSRPTGATRRPRELTPAPEALPSAKRPKPRREEKPETAVKPRPKPRVVTPVEDREPAPKPAAPRRPRVAPKPKDAPEGSKLTPKEASDVKPNEEFPDYVNRKYNEYAKRVRKIREDGGDAGMLRRAEWYAINKGNLRDAWGSANGKTAPESFEPPAPRPRRPRNNRNRRRNASDANAEASASRRPKPEDKPEVAPISPIKPKKRVDKNAPTKDFEHSGTAYRDFASGQDKARQLATREGKDFHVVAYVGNGHDGGADKYYVLDDDQYNALKKNEALKPESDGDDGKWREEGLVRAPDRFQQQAAEEAARILAEADAERARDREPFTVPDKPESVEAPSASKPASAPKSGGKIKNLFQRKRKGRAEQPLGEDNQFGINVGKRVDVGENGIKTEEDAIDALSGEGKVGDIPDKFLFDALKGNAADVNTAMQRAARQYLQDFIDNGIVDVPFDADLLISNGYGQFIFAQALASADLDLPDEIQQMLEELDSRGKLPKYITLKGGSAAGPEFFFALSKRGSGEYTISGEGYIVKPEDPYASNANLAELVGVELAQYFGAPQEGGRVDGIVPYKGQAIILALANNFIDGKQKVGNYSPEQTGASRVHVLMMNALMGMGDRHEMNGLVYKGEDGNEALVPIDFGRALQESSDVDEDSLREYAQYVFSMDPNAGFRRRDKQELTEIGKTYIENLKKIDFDDMQKRLIKMWDGKGLTPGDINEFISTMDERVTQMIDLLENQGLGDILFP
jgi:hypothetical protein